MANPLLFSPSKVLSKPKAKRTKPIQPTNRTETDIQREILEALIHSGYMVWRNNSGAFWNHARQAYVKVQGVGRINGVSDILGVLPDGTFLAIEVKSRTGRLTEEQKVFLLKVSNRGGLAFMARSLEDVQKAFKACPWPIPQPPLDEDARLEQAGWVKTGGV